MMGKHFIHETGAAIVLFWGLFKNDDDVILFFLIKLDPMNGSMSAKLRKKGLIMFLKMESSGTSLTFPLPYNQYFFLCHVVCELNLLEHQSNC